MEMNPSSPTSNVPGRVSKAATKEQNAIKSVINHINSFLLLKVIVENDFDMILAEYYLKMKMNLSLIVLMRKKKIDIGNNLYKNCTK